MPLYILAAASLFFTILFITIIIKVGKTHWEHENVRNGCDCHI